MHDILSIYNDVLLFGKNDWLDAAPGGPRIGGHIQEAALSRKSRLTRRLRCWVLVTDSDPC